MTQYLEADWPAHSRVRTLVSTRAGGVSTGAWASFNLGLQCGDKEQSVLENRRRLRTRLPAEPAWLRQVHGRDVASWTDAQAGVEADAIITGQSKQVCVILTADCLPVLVADVDGRQVAAIHAGWRGLAAGIIEHTIKSMPVAPDRLMAWLGPAISSCHYQVGEEVRAAFLERSVNFSSAFVPDGDRWKADLYQLARQQLQLAGVKSVHGGNYCTFGEPDRFYSYRRDGQTGRMASLVWLSGE
ncbi:MAG: peptidoglycan editing factor PgeF [Xanthomonadales bacterium]|nr:peptidoglycan editing factor PgeF [Xanthomonadales bacterium]